MMMATPTAAMRAAATARQYKLKIASAFGAVMRLKMSAAYAKVIIQAAPIAKAHPMDLLSLITAAYATAI